MPETIRNDRVERRSQVSFLCCFLFSSSLSYSAVKLVRHANMLQQTIWLSGQPFGCWLIPTEVTADHGTVSMEAEVALVVEVEASVVLAEALEVAAAPVEVGRGDFE